jgi:nicotinamidase/pyrazinamidase
VDNARPFMGSYIVAASSPRSALLIVDVQKDFCPGGALAVPGGDRVVPVLNGHIANAEARGWTIYASRDWHPRETGHFQAFGGQWPPHCVQESEGARFHDALRLPPSAIVITKGQAPDSHGYSALEGLTPDGHTLLDDLRARQIERLYVGGLATDYCVKHSVLDARAAGLDVVVLGGAIAGVDLQPGDSTRALAEMEAAGAAVG